MTIRTLHQLFVHNLEDIYYAEKELLDALSQLEAQSESEQIATAFREHRQETEGQLDRLERVFEMLETDPETEECEGIEGLLKEHDEFVEENREGKLLDLHNLVAGQKTEHYEIAAYGNLARLAAELDMENAGELLEETLDEEETALEKLDSLTDYAFDEVRGSTVAD